MGKALKWLAISWLVTGGVGFSNAADNMYFSGALVAEPCVIPPGKEQIELQFGSVMDKYLYLNQRTPGLPFQIVLADCDPSLGKTVKITMTGMESAALPGLLALAAGSMASGIAIGLETSAGLALPINKPSGKYTLAAGSNQVQLKAYVQAEPNAIANKKVVQGDFNTVATFSLEYE